MTFDVLPICRMLFQTLCVYRSEVGVILILQMRKTRHRVGNCPRSPSWEAMQPRAPLPVLSSFLK